MGIPMDDFHTPTVPSGPTTAQGAGRDLSKLGLKALLDEKQSIETELKQLSDVLKSHEVDMHTPLLTADGFPRADLDIAQIRTTRVRIIRLRNDYKDVLGYVESGIHEYFANIHNAAGVDLPQNSTQNTARSSQPPTLARPPQDVQQLLDGWDQEVIEAPFAKVNNIFDGSPAAGAGMKLGDKILRFGDITWVNHENLTKVADVVQNNEGVSHFKLA
ncbi:putative 26S proteasome regulatory subunit [Myotisia sp. PD_48]|nr:putative 26S proteasome regulatory subunit [Myotisia sp. PD_48]